MVLITGCVYANAKTVEEHQRDGLPIRDTELTPEELVGLRPSLEGLGVHIDHDMGQVAGKIVKASIERDGSGVARNLSVLIDADDARLQSETQDSHRFLSLRHMLYTNSNAEGAVASRLGAVGIEVSFVRQPGRNYTAHRPATPSDINAFSVCAGTSDINLSETPLVIHTVTSTAFEYNRLSPGSKQGKQKYKTPQIPVCTTHHPHTPLTHTHAPPFFCPSCPQRRRLSTRPP